MIKPISLISGGTIAKAGTFVTTVNVEAAIKDSLTVTVVCNHTGGTITITLKWSPDGVNFISQAAAGTGDVDAIGTGDLAWDNFVIPGIPSALEITITETNVAAVTDIDATLVCR